MTLIDTHSVSHPLSHRDGKLRCVCVDSEPKVSGHTLRSDKKHGNFFREENMIVGQSGRGNNFALGYYGLEGETEENSLTNRTMNVIRKEVERCDYFAGINFQIYVTCKVFCYTFLDDEVSMETSCIHS
jgi:hypothetical protein